jgi:hypothetical protein
MHRSKLQDDSITLSASASRVGGKAIPRSLAVFKLMTNSNFVGCSTGRLAGRGFLGGVGEQTIWIAARCAQRLLWRGDQIIDNSVTKLLPQRTIDRSGILFSSIVSNLHLPPRRNPIILPRKVGISPVGVRP